MYDLTVIGAGLAGLQLARLAARGGASVLLADARADVTQTIRTTGIFVRRTFEDFAVLEPFLGPPIRSIGIHSPAGRTIELTGRAGEFRVGRMKPLCEAMLRQGISAGVRWSPSTVYAGSRAGRDAVEVRFRDGTSVRTRLIAGADGARSRVAADLGLSRNGEWIAGIENVYASDSSGPPRFDCWVDPRLAPGYLAWLLDDGEEVHAGVGGDPGRFRPVVALREFERLLRAEGRLVAAAALERRGGLIPVNGVLPRIAGGRGLLVGDAAGAVSPLTAGGLDACMRLSAHASAVVLRVLREGLPALAQYDGAAFRSRFAARLAMRRAFDLCTRSPAAIELGFTLGGVALGGRFARHVFFGRGSFPDAPSIASPRGRVPSART